MTLQGVMTPYRSRRGSDTLRFAHEKTATARRRALMIALSEAAMSATRPLRSSYERRLETGVPKSKCDGDLRVPARANSWKRADLAIIWHCRKIKPRATAFKPVAASTASHIAPAARWSRPTSLRPRGGSCDRAVASRSGSWRGSCSRRLGHRPRPHRRLGWWVSVCSANDRVHRWATNGPPRRGSWRWRCGSMTPPRRERRS